MYIDGLEIEGSVTDFEVLRINYKMCSMAFHNKAQAIAERFGGVENEE